jgi:thiol-disulfide isomerase/thioredoxin
MNGRACFIYMVVIAVLASAQSMARGATETDPPQVQNSPEPDVTVTLALEGTTVEGTPVVASAENTARALYLVNPSSPDFIAVEETGHNQWTCTLKSGKRYVVGWISEKMYGYLSEPFLAKEGLRISFSPGIPTTFEYDLRHPPKDVETIPAQVMLLREIISDGKRTFLSWAMPNKVKKPSIVKVEGLAAGTYQISARTADASKHFKNHTPMLYEDRVVEIRPATVNRFEPNYPEIDTTVEPGDLTVRGVAYDAKGKPLRRKTVCLTPTPEKRLDLKLYYPATRTDREGRFEFTGIRPNMGIVLWCSESPLMLRPEWAGDDATISVDFVVGRQRMNIEVGEPIGSITIDWRNGQVGRLSDLKGKVVVLDFWASWCGPCIRSLPGLNVLADKYANRQDVIFVALSVDTIREVWEKKVDTSGWTALLHGWQDRQKNPVGYQGGIPFCVVIDQDGVVRAAGHFLELQSELDRLLGTVEHP